MRNITMTCPHCGTPERAVGDPDEKDEGHSGKWYCFACGASGTYRIEHTLTRTAEPAWRDGPGSLQIVVAPLVT